VRRRWLSLCTVWPSHSQWLSEHISFIETMRLPILQLPPRLFLANYHITQVCQPPYSPDLAPYKFWLFPTLKSPLKGRIFFNATVTPYTSCQRRLTAEWLAPRESDCSRMHSKVSSDWLPSYIKATRPALEIFKMVGYFPDSPRTVNTPKPTSHSSYCSHIHLYTHTLTNWRQF